MVSSRRNKLKKGLSPTNPLPPANTEDDELVNDLLAQLDARDSNLHGEAAEVLHVGPDKERDSSETVPKKNSRIRFKAREMRKAAEHVAQQTPDDSEASERMKREIEDEERAIRAICDEKGLEMYEGCAIDPDGHCLFSAIADQLAHLSIISTKTANYHTTRRAAADYIASHPDDFIPFLPSTDGEDGAEATESGLMNLQQFHKYCANIRDTGAWGGEPEILALASAFNIPIHVIQRGTPPVVVHSPHAASAAVPTDRAVYISYHRRMYGLGEHYNSLRPKSRHYD